MGGSTPYVILGLLSIEPMSGYEIRQNLQESLSHFWSESYGQIYPALRRMAAQGLIAPVKHGHTGSRARRYTLTARGRTALRCWLAEPPRAQPPRNELILRIFFGRLAPRGAAAEHLRRFCDQQQQLLATLQTMERQLLVERRGHPDLRFWTVALDAGFQVRRALIRWSERALATLAGDRRAARRRGPRS